jgi:hypothetical protein
VSLDGRGLAAPEPDVPLLPEAEPRHLALASVHRNHPVWGRQSRDADQIRAVRLALPVLPDRQSRSVSDVWAVVHPGIVLEHQHLAIVAEIQELL